MCRRRGWLEEGGWWSKEDWGFKLKFTEGTENTFFDNDDSSVLQLEDVVKYVTQVLHEARSLGLGIETLFDALDRSKPSLMEAINVHLTDAEVRRLARAIESGCLQSLKHLRILNDIGDGHSTLVEAMVSGELPSLETLILSNIRLDNVHLQSYGIALAEGKLPSLSCLNVSSNEISDEGAKSLGRAIQSGQLKNLTEIDMRNNRIADEGLIAIVRSFQDGVSSLLPNLQFLKLSHNVALVDSFTEVGLSSLAEALKSGHLNSLKVIDVRGSTNPSKEGASALVSAFSSNNCLTVHVEFEWYKFPQLDRRRKQLLERNSRNRDILAGLEPVPKVQATFGKLYICGNPEVGKTTLCHTLQRSYWRSKITREKKAHVEKRTRGIDVSQLSSKGKKKDEIPITLLVWDMAGQEDFHLVHNAFFPDLGFAEGKATTFIVVCSSKNSLLNSMEQLEYWLRYIASSCDKTIQNPRHVFFVMNNFGGRQEIHGHAQKWKVVLEDQRKKFERHLEIQTDLFLVDVREFQQIDGLKSCLLQHSRDLLRNQKVPNICYDIQKHLCVQNREKKKNLSVLIQQREQFPVLRWTEFVKQVVHQLQKPWPEPTIEAAIKYLNEAGVIIYICKEGVRLVIVDPDWFCREIIGRVFLPWDMESSTEDLFRTKVVQTTGSISILSFKKFFKSLKEGGWNDTQVDAQKKKKKEKKREKQVDARVDAQVDDLIDILVWLGLCYKGKDENIFLPALIAEKGTPGEPWCQTRDKDVGDQWVMGFSVRHQKSEVALAPISLWHKFQVDLAQTPKFNGQTRLDNDFIADKYFVTFVVDYMNVLIKVDANLDKPTFEEITILVKPRFEKDELDATERKQCQVDLANDLVERLLKLWDQVCPGVEYEEKVIWPWPASWSRPKHAPERNVEVAEVKKWIQERGMGTKMQWVVGSCDPITEDQLLSTKDKRDVVQSVEHSLSIVRQGVKEAVTLRIFPSDVWTDAVFFVKSVLAPDGIDTPKSPAPEEQDEMNTNISNLLKPIENKLDKVENKLDKVYKKLGDVETVVREVREGIGKVLKKQKQVLHKLQDTETMFLEDKQSICPKFISLGTSNSAWVTLKDTLSLRKTVCLRFACEAGYGNYRPHVDVKGQQGLDISQLTDWGRTIVPWLRVSLTVLFITAKVAANVVAPGVGLILPSSVQWKQVSSLSEGIASATGYSNDQLEKMIQGTRLDTKDAQEDHNARLYLKSRKVIGEVLRRLKPQEFEEKIGLRKVNLKYPDGSLYGIVWICTECFEKFPGELVSEV